MDLIDRLAAHRTLASVPRHELEWLARVGVPETIERGVVLTTTSGGAVRGLFVIFDGHLIIRVDRGAGPRIVMEWRGGDVTGLMPFSRVKTPPGDVVAEEPTHVLFVDRSHIPAISRECPELTAVLVHVMLDRVRIFKSSELLDEKLASLGRLAAGLAHELNNPASAVARSAKTLVSELDAFDAASQQYSALNLTADQARTIAAVHARHVERPRTLTPIELADRQDAIDAWLGARGVTAIDTQTLAERGFDTADLETLTASVGIGCLHAVLAHESSALTIRQLVAEIDTAATRIHSLVTAVKGFTYVDQQTVPKPVAIGQGIADTVTVLRAKARQKQVRVEVHVADGLPAVDGYGGELNQVWSNLLDNAIDAAPGGQVRIDAAVEGKNVVVCVRDNGPGIPPEIRSRIFDPFFTTKDVGDGTGLGLDIARRIVQRHQGIIDLNTGPEGTEFRVSLPVSHS
jgi:signal transduction histidine kinase